MANATMSKDEILDAIGNMSVFELAELIESFKSKFNVTISAAAPAAPAPTPPKAPIADPVKWTTGPKFEVAVDTSTLLDIAPTGVGGRATHTLAQFDAALAGRTPVIPQQTYREFVVGQPEFV